MTVTDADPPLHPATGSVGDASGSPIDEDVWERPVTVRRVALETLVAVGVGLVAAIAVTWPLVTKLGHTGHDAFDPRFQAWTIDWVQHKLGSPGSLFDANIFAPEPHTLAYSDSLLGIAIPMLPFRWLGVSPIGQLNIALLLSFATTFASGYLFGRVVTRSIVVGALTGVAFAFGPFGSVSSGVIHATAHAGVGVAAAAAWWLADRAGRRRAARCSRRAALAGRGTRLAGVGLVLSRRVRLRCGRGDPARALALRSDGEAGSWAAGALAVAGACTLAMAIPYLQVRDEQPGFTPHARRPPAARRRLRRHRPAPVASGVRSSGKGGGWPIYGEPAFPGLFLLVLAPIGAICGWRSRARYRLATIGGARAGARGRSSSASARGRPGWRRFAPYRLLFEYVPGLGGAARHRPGLGGRTARRGRAGRPRRARGRRLGGAAAPWTHPHGDRRVGGGRRARGAGRGLRAVDRRRRWDRRRRGRHPSTSTSPSSPPGGVLYLPALEQGAGAPPRGPQRLPPGRERLRHDRAPPAHAERLLRLLPAVVEAPLARDGVVARRGHARAPPLARHPLRRGARLGREAPCGLRCSTPRGAAPLRHLGTYDGDVLYEVPAAEGS